MAETAAQSRLMNDVRMRVPGALDAAIKQELFSAVDEFMKGTNLWKEQIDFVTSVGIKTYSVASDEDGAIISLIGVVNSWNVFGAQAQGILVPFIDALIDSEGPG